MEFINKVDLSKYVITLDSLDLGLLPTYPRLNTGSLWTVNSKLNSNEYYEFQVKPKTENGISVDDESDTGNDNTDPISESQFILPTTKSSINSTTCNICDIDLPTAYIDDHEDSLKHKAYLKIADTMLERTRKHMVKKKIRYIKKNLTKYFCGPCAVEVEINNRVIHEKSKEHKRSMSLDRVLYELVALLMNEDIEKEEINESYSEVKDSVIISDVKARLDELKVNSVENYIKFVNESDLKKPYVLSTVDNRVKISIDDIEIVIDEDNFNGFVWLDDSLFCLICRIIVEEEKTHKISRTHLNNITKPFKDNDFVRILENFRYHCVICNKIVSNIDLHVSCDESHKELLEKALIINSKALLINEPNKNKTLEHNTVTSIDNNVYEHNETVNGVNTDMDNNLNETVSNILLKSIRVTATNPTQPKPDEFTKIDSVTYLCNPCNIQLHGNNIESHRNGNKHALNLKSNLHYNMVQGLGNLSSLICRVCKTYVADDANEVKSHVATSEHTQKYTEILAKNQVIKRQGNFYCKPCKLVILKRNELFHLETLKHETELDCFNNKGIKLNDNQNAIPAINTTTTDSKASNTSYFCNICQVKVPNNVFNIKDHNDGGRHKRNVLKAQEEANSFVSYNKNNTNDTIQLHYQMEAIENEKNLMCRVCKVAIPNIQESINEHINGKKHDATFKSVIEDNTVECVGEEYFCKGCNLDVNPKNLFEHIKSPKHVAQSALDKTADIANAISAYLVQAENAASQTNDTTHNNNDEETVEDAISADDEVEEIVDTDMLNSTFTHDFTELGDKKLKCKVCVDVCIPKTAEAIAKHLNSETHVDQYKKLMECNFIFKTEENMHLCVVCNCLVPLKGEVDHAKGRRHAGNFLERKLFNEDICTACKIFVPTMSQPSHEKLASHVSNLLKNQTLMHYCEHCQLLFNKNKAEGHEENCHKCVVKDKICFCTKCDPYLPGSSTKK